MRSPRARLLAGGLAASVMVGMSGAAASLSDPPANIAPNPHYPSMCANGAGVIDNTQTCINALVQAIDNARSQEGVGALVLPTHFASLPGDQQLLVITDRERVDRGLPPFTGLVDELNGPSFTAAHNDTDPSLGGGGPSYAGNSWHDTATFADGQVNALGADYQWMYNDGWGGSAGNTVNRDCTGPGSTSPTDLRGCWSHRHAILFPFPEANLSMGAGEDPSSADGRQAWTLLMAGTGGQPSAYTYTWAQALADMPGAPAPCGAASPPSGKINRLAGDNRDLTAVMISQQSFPQVNSAGSAVVAVDDNYPDALAGGVLAAAKHGPLLITPPTGLADAVRTEIRRIVPAGQTVYVLGGTLALPSSVDNQLTADGYQVVRIAGASRYETAVKIADVLGDPSTVFEATGNAFPDALAAGPAAISTQGAILLTNGSQQADATSSYLSAHPGKRYAIGGPAAAADPSATVISGPTRYDTAVDVTQTFFTAPKTLGFATGEGFADALSAGPALGTSGTGLILVPKCPPLPNVVTGYLQSVTTTVANGTLYGGTFVVSDDTLTQIDQALTPH